VSASSKNHPLLSVDSDKCFQCARATGLAPSGRGSVSDRLLEAQNSGKPVDEPVKAARLASPCTKGHLAEAASTVSGELADRHADAASPITQEGTNIACDSTNHLDATLPILEQFASDCLPMRAQAAYR